MRRGIPNMSTALAVRTGVAKKPPVHPPAMERPPST